MEEFNKLPLFVKVFIFVVCFLFGGIGFAANHVFNSKNQDFSQNYIPDTEYKKISIIVRNDNTLSPIAGVEVEFSYQGSPTIKKTNSDGYVEH